jgi:hypothetical protein
MRSVFSVLLTFAAIISKRFTHRLPAAIFLDCLIENYLPEARTIAEIAAEPRLVLQRLSHKRRLHD